MKRFIIPLLVLLLSACANQAPAPVSDRGFVRDGAVVDIAKPGYYTVKKGDTLYSIALDNGQSYRDVAAWNSLDNPNVIKVGQSLRVAPPDQAAQATAAQGEEVVKPISNNDVQPVVAAPVAAPASATFQQSPLGGKQPYSDDAWARAQNPQASQAAVSPQVVAAPASAPAADKPAVVAAAAGDDIADWAWPTAGKVGTPFSESGSKGIDIPAKLGQPVYAAAGGTVTLVSNAVRGYGNLVVIKHSPTWLSVYAHNGKVLVEEKQTVTKGQKIAEVGATDADSPMLHFEIRRMGKPVDPLKYLPPR
ncbi:MAG TPA: peptidoglycan DD-metalloendopeptidase family protein [Rhodocyclaceae bacterium]|jgi:lipoprotein NlpD|nr:peptidoglycan DD-metalloendopeptidase family protein [Rhodocyclaceae bacterium]